MHNGCNCGIITTMNTTIKIHDATRKKLKLLAAMLDKSMVDVLDELVDRALREAQSSGNSQGVQVSHLSE